MILLSLIYFVLSILFIFLLNPFAFIIIVPLLLPLSTVAKNLIVSLAALLILDISLVALQTLRLKVSHLLPFLSSVSTVLSLVSNMTLSTISKLLIFMSNFKHLIMSIKLSICNFLSFLFNLKIKN